MKRVTVLHKRGMTLVEVLVVSAIFTVVLQAITVGVIALYKSNAYALAQSYQVQYARQGISSMVRDIREMTYADDGTFPLARMEPNAIGFYSDIDRDKSVEYVEYELTDTTLVKRIYNATGTPVTYDTASPDTTLTISEYVQNIDQATSTFYYFDTYGDPATPATTVTDIRYIGVQLIVNVKPLLDPGEFMLRGSAALRNVMDNI